MHCQTQESQDANTDLIRKAMSMKESVKSKYKCHAIFSNTILNLQSNFAPHETLICDKRDPPWLKTKIKSLIEDKKKIQDNSNIKTLQKLKTLQERFSSFSISKKNIKE